jgi:hypothetical protein
MHKHPTIYLPLQQPVEVSEQKGAVKAVPVPAHAPDGGVALLLFVGGLWG